MSTRHVAPVTLLICGFAVLCAACTSNTSLYDFDGDGAVDSVDCAPEDPAIYPGATESCADGIDNNCDSWTDCADSDCQTESACAGGDDDSSLGDDDSSAGDDDTSLGDDDTSAGDDDTSAGDDDWSGGDDDSSAGDDDDDTSAGDDDTGDDDSTPSGDDDSTPSSPQCSDGLDNDGDSLVDFPADTNCTSASDDNEALGENDVVWGCSDGGDNDGDFLVDCDDPDCIGDMACPGTGGQDPCCAAHTQPDFSACDSFAMQTVCGARSNPPGGNCCANPMEWTVACAYSFCQAGGCPSLICP